jgi:ABC-type nitrate/sulfonate/bicarbonate transport system permease component
MPERRSERLTARLVGFASLALVLGAWEVAGREALVNPILLSRPSLVAVTLWEIISAGDFLRPLGQTVALFATGYAIASVLGVAIGVAMGVSKAAYGLLEPLVELLRPVPKPALVPALFLFLGIGEATRITVVVLAAIFPVLINTLQGVRGIDPVLLDTARTFRCSRWRTVFQVVLPAAMPGILAGMKVGLGLGLVLVVLAEMLAGETGLGYLILDLQRSFQIRDMYAWVIILAALGGVLSLVFDKAERHLVPWRGRG